MIVTGVWTSILIIAVLAYVIFVFIAESANPLKRPNGFGQSSRQRRHIKLRRWRLARAIAFAFMVASIAIVMLTALVDLSEFRQQWVLMVIALLFVIAVIAAIARYFITAKKKVAKQSESASQVHSEDQASHQPQSLAEVTATSNQAPPIEPAKVVQSDYDDVELARSEEHELEIELATSRIDPNITDFDLSIAEAEFHPAESSDFSTTVETFSNIAGDEHPSDRVTGLQQSIDIDDQIDIDHAYTSEPSGGARHPADLDRELLFKKLSDKDAQIRTLSGSNTTLERIREELETDVVEMRQAVSKSNALQRKYKAQLEEVSAIKDKALTLATIERKKRRIIEIRAQKALIKYQKALASKRIEENLTES